MDLGATNDKRVIAGAVVIGAYWECSLRVRTGTSFASGAANAVARG
jgi:hypothetical protein